MSTTGDELFSTSWWSKLHEYLRTSDAYDRKIPTTPDELKALFISKTLSELSVTGLRNLTQFVADDLNSRGDSEGYATFLVYKKKCLKKANLVQSVQEGLNKLSGTPEVPAAVVKSPGRKKVAPQVPSPPPPPPPQPPSITSYTPEEVSVSKHLSPFQELCTVITLREVQLKQPTVVLDTVVRIPKDVFDNIQQKQRNPSRIHIALVEEKEIVPVSWPYSKEFSLFVSNQQVSDTSIPKPYCAKKGQLPKQCKLFQSLDITSYIKFPSVQIQLKNKPASMGKGFLLHPPCRVLIFAVRDLDAEVVTESCQRNLQRRPWTDTTTCGDDLAVDRQIISLRCSFGHIPIVTPVRSAKCTHPQVIELVSFLVHVHRSRSWRCPVCDALCEEGLKSIIIDQGIVQYLEAARGRVPAKVVITASGDVENVPTPVSLTASDSFQSYPPEGAENDENDDDENDDDIPPAKRVRTGSSSNGMLKTNSSASSSLRHNSANTAYRNTRDTALEID